jgi:hypothetical protein
MTYHVPLDLILLDISQLLDHLVVPFRACYGVTVMKL